jgi:hypothetical protein
MRLYYKKLFKKLARPPDYYSRSNDSIVMPPNSNGWTIPLRAHKIN